MVGAGAVVTQDVPPHAIVVGNPARIMGYVETGNLEPVSETAAPLGLQSDASVVDLGVGGATLHRLRLVKDMRGDLSAGEFERQIPFTPKRYFLVFDVPTPRGPRRARP